MAESYVKSPAGELGTVPETELQSALQNGYTQVSPEELSAYQNEEKYGGTGQQIITGLEGAASAATFGLSTGVERALGVDPEDIRARRETNPGSYMTGQVAGLVGSALIPVAGAANVLGRAGQAAVTAARIGEASTLAKIGSLAVRSGVENAVFQAGDEVSKMLASDPHQSVETAITNMGISGLLGGGVGAGIGAVSPLWKATLGGKVGQALESLKNKAGGIDGTIPDAVHDATQKLGLNLSPEVKARLSDDAWVQAAAKGLEQTDTTASGRSFQETMKSFKGDLNNSLLESFGRTQDDIGKVAELSKYEAGKSIGETLAKEVDSRIDPLAKEFEALKGKYKDVDLIPDQFTESDVMSPDGLSMTRQKEVIPGTVSNLSEKISQLANDQGWMALPDSEIMGLVNKTMKNLPRQKTMRNLTDFISQIGKEANKDALNFELKRAGQLIKGVLQDGEADVIMNALGKEGPELVERFQAVRGTWKEQAQLLNQIDDRLKIRGSTSSFSRNIRDMSATEGEKLLQRLSGSKDADLLRVLNENFPETAQAVKQYQVDEILKKAYDRAAPGEPINPKALLKAIDNMSPEMREFAISPEILEKTKAVGELLEQLDKAPHNFSNTARTMDKLFNYVPATAVGMATMIAGGNPILAGAMGFLTKALSKDAPDAVKLAMLKFMASGQPIEAGAFKATVDVIEQTIKGEAAINRSVRKVFKSTREALPTKNDKISDNDREKLDKKVVALMKDPEPLMNVGGESAYYLPEQATAMAETAGRVLQFLASKRPDDTPQSPLDPKPVISKAQKAAYNRSLDLAEKPLIILNDIKDGTLTQDDLIAVRTMYPSLYNNLVLKFSDEIAQRQQDEDPIPYKMRISLSLFMGQPLDSTMLPNNIMANQTAMVNPPMQPPPQKGSVQKINKIASMSATPTQMKEMRSLDS